MAVETAVRGVESWWGEYGADEWSDALVAAMKLGGVDNLFFVSGSELVFFQEDYVGLSLLKFYGEDNVLWASDYPHPDSTWPNSQRTIEKQMAALPPEVRQRLTHDNAAKLYRIDVPATARAGVAG